jgi:hypothetical protein
MLTATPLIYCDHNYVVTALQGPGTYQAHLRHLAATSTATFILWPMHWIEAAEDIRSGHHDSLG